MRWSFPRFIFFNEKFFFTFAWMDKNSKICISMRFPVWLRKRLDVMFRVKEEGRKKTSFHWRFVEIQKEVWR